MVKVQEMTSTEDELEAKWVEAIDEPWAKGLPYVMAAAADVHYSPKPISYGFPTGDTVPSHPLDFDRLSTSSSVTHVSFYESEFLSVTDVDVEMQPGFAGKTRFSISYMYYCKCTVVLTLYTLENTHWLMGCYMEVSYKAILLCTWFSASLNHFLRVYRVK